MREAWQYLWRDIKGAFRLEVKAWDELGTYRRAGGYFFLCLLLLLPLIVEHAVASQDIAGREVVQSHFAERDRTVRFLGGRAIRLAQPFPSERDSPEYAVFCERRADGEIAGVVGRFSGIMMRSETMPECGLFTGKWLPVMLAILLFCAILSLVRTRWVQYLGIIGALWPTTVIFVLSMGWLIRMPFRGVEWFFL